MDVNDYLRANIHNFNVEYLEMVFDLQNMAEIMDSKETSVFLQNIEAQFKFDPSNIQKEREMRFLYFVHSASNSCDTTDRFSSIATWKLADPKASSTKRRKNKQKSKSEISSTKRRSRSR